MFGSSSGYFQPRAETAKIFGCNTSIEKGHELAKSEIFSRCKSHLDDADIVIALLDASQVDDGTAWEIGYFYARKSSEQKIIGVRTDFRRAGESSGAMVNAMIEGSCDWVVRTREELMETISLFFNTSAVREKKNDL